MQVAERCYQCSVAKGPRPQGAAGVEAANSGRPGPDSSQPQPEPTSHIRLLFLQMSTCSGAMTRPVKGPISVPALIHVLEKMPRPSPGMELCAMITSAGSTRLDSFCTSVAAGELGQSPRTRPVLPSGHILSPEVTLCVCRGVGGVEVQRPEYSLFATEGPSMPLNVMRWGSFLGGFFFFSLSTNSQSTHNSYCLPSQKSLIITEPTAVSGLTNGQTEANSHLGGAG